jgi:ethanolamine ammonia-lyase large subunit
VSGFGEGVGALAEGIGNGLGNVVDSVNPVDDFMDNIQTIIIVVVCVISVVVIIIIIAVICCIVNKKEIAKVGRTVFETMIPGGVAVGREMRHLYDDDGRNSQNRNNIIELFSLKFN